LGESWPFFRPNFVNMEQYKTDMSVDEVTIQTAQTRLVRVPAWSACRVLAHDAIHIPSSPPNAIMALPT